MDSYGLKIKSMWAQNAPETAAATSEDFFMKLGDQVATRVEEICRKKESQIPPWTEYWSRVQEMTQIRQEAEEIAFQELVEPSLRKVTEADLSAQESLQEALMELPTLPDLREMISRGKNSLKFPENDPKMSLWLSLLPILESATTPPEDMSAVQCQKLLSEIENVTAAHGQILA